MVGSIKASNITNVGGNYRDRESAPNQEIYSFAEIVFVDKIHEDAPSFLYQMLNYTLCSDNVNLQPSSHLSKNEDTFSFGEIESIDRQKKIVYLRNGNTVGYTYLIVASGKNSTISLRSASFNAGLQALIDALKVKPKIPSSFCLARKSDSKSLSKKQSNPSNGLKESASVSSRPIDELMLNSISSANEKESSGFNTADKRLYEVQL